MRFHSWADGGPNCSLGALASVASSILDSSGSRVCSFLLTSLCRHPKVLRSAFAACQK